MGPKISPLVLVVTAEEDLPAWFKSFWEHLSKNLLKQSAIIERQLDEIKKLQPAYDGARELMTRVTGVEIGILGVESKLDKIVRESEQATAHLQSVDTRLEKQDKDFIKIKQELEPALQARPQTNEERAFQALPLAQGCDGVTANKQGGVTTAQNQ